MFDTLMFLGLGGVTPPALTSSAFSFKSWLETGPPRLLPLLDILLESQLPLCLLFLCCFLDLGVAPSFSITTSWIIFGFKTCLLDSSFEMEIFHECLRIISLAMLCLAGELPVIIALGCSTFENLRFTSSLAMLVFLFWGLLF